MQEVNFDTLLRYDPVVKIINKSGCNKYPILEVGSGMNGISDYYKGKVVGVDSDFSRTGERKNLNIAHVRGKATKLPFKNNSFYCVVCLDTLEHLPDNQREKAVYELVRVAKKNAMIFLGFPTGDLSKKFEGKVSYLYKRKYKIAHLWLREHKIYGLPEEHKIVITLQKNGIILDEIKVIKNANLIVWFIIHFLFTVHASSVISKLFKIFFTQFTNLLKVKIPPYYRVILVINK